MTIYAVACHMTKSDGLTTTSSVTLEIIKASTNDEARGLGVAHALSFKTGFAIADVLVQEALP